MAQLEDSGSPLCLTFPSLPDLERLGEWRARLAYHWIRVMAFSALNALDELSGVWV
jgi:hypothetical protein